MRRLAIFMLYDPAGRVPAHVPATLAALRGHVARLIVVSNGPLSAQGRAVMADLARDEAFDLARDLIERDNEDFDVGAYRAGLGHVGFAALADFDEVVLCNYTFFVSNAGFGPMFAAMADRGHDAWAITAYRGPDKAFLQSYFLVTRPRLHASPAYAAYWQDMPQIADVAASLTHHEFRFTPHFERLGYALGAYIEPDPAGSDGWDGNTTLLDLEGLHARGMPVVKYRALTFAPNLLQRRGGRPPAEVLGFLAASGAYDMAAIWDYLIACQRPDDLIASAGLIRQAHAGSPQAGTVAILAHLEDPRTLDLALGRLSGHVAMVASGHSAIRAAAAAAGHRVLEMKESGAGLMRALAGWEGEAGTLICLADFPAERARYGFLPQLFEAYWDPLLGPAPADWLREAPHLGLILPLPEAVDGREAGLRGLDPDLRDWALDGWPAEMPMGQQLWPWRGICALRGAALAALRGPLAAVVAAHRPRPGTPFAGAEAALPQLMRQAGLASGVMLGQAAPALILRAGLAMAQAEAEAEARARRLRAEVALMRSPGGAIGPAQAGLDATPVTLEIRDANRPDETRVILTPQGQAPLALRPTAFVRHAIDLAEIREGRAWLRGWAFDQDQPDMPMFVGLLCEGRLLGRFQMVAEPRHDVRDAFAQMQVQADCGFDLQRALPAGAVPGGMTAGLRDPWRRVSPKLRLCFVDLARTKVALVPLPQG